MIEANLMSGSKMATTYDGYLLEGSSTSKLSIGANDTTLIQGTIAGPADGVLGGSQGGAFSMLDGLATFTYVGTAEIGTTLGFVAEGSNGDFYFFTVSGTFEPPTHKENVQNLQTPQSGNPGPDNGEYNYTTHTNGCFVGGTVIATPSGGAAVETLKAGDLVVTADGSARAVRWIGYSVVSRFLAGANDVLPIRIKAGALGPSRPSRDLCVSPGHAIEVDGLLINAGVLVNGESIVRDEDAPLVFTYYHLELDRHDLVLAENTPAESFLEVVAEMDMDNWGERVLIPGEAPREEMALPRVKSPRQVPAALRERLAARAAHALGPVHA